MREVKLLTYGEAALRLECSTRTIRRYLVRGLLEKVSINSRVVRVTAASVERVFSANAANGPSVAPSGLERQ